MKVGDHVYFYWRKLAETGPPIKFKINGVKKFVVPGCVIPSQFKCNSTAEILSHCPVFDTWAVRVNAAIELHNYGASNKAQEACEKLGIAYQVELGVIGLTTEMLKRCCTKA